MEQELITILKLDPEQLDAITTLFATKDGWWYSIKDFVLPIGGVVVGATSSLLGGYFQDKRASKRDEIRAQRQWEIEQKKLERERLDKHMVEALNICFSFFDLKTRLYQTYIQRDVLKELNSSNNTLSNGQKKYLATQYSSCINEIAKLVDEESLLFQKIIQTCPQEVTASAEHLSQTVRSLDEANHTFLSEEAATKISSSQAYFMSTIRNYFCDYIPSEFNPFYTTTPTTPPSQPAQSQTHPDE